MRATPSPPSATASTPASSNFLARVIDRRRRQISKTGKTRLPPERVACHPLSGQKDIPGAASHRPASVPSAIKSTSSAHPQPHAKCGRATGPPRSPSSKVTLNVLLTDTVGAAISTCRPRRQPSQPLGASTRDLRRWHSNTTPAAPCVSQEHPTTTVHALCPLIDSFSGVKASRSPSTVDVRPCHRHLPVCATLPLALRPDVPRTHGHRAIHSWFSWLLDQSREACVIPRPTTLLIVPHAARPAPTILGSNPALHTHPSSSTTHARARPSRPRLEPSTVNRSPSIVTEHELADPTLVLGADDCGPVPRLRLHPTPLSAPGLYLPRAGVEISWPVIAT
ncbi:hypothetical protein FA95DRAFT_1223626 [Auriscalpium vulgare]|uniref:Uncharacterized protein n=1 Tax=Auriscalpium vulgare TaxID=40419 RepID=A0ACB8R311_9AGAM|nr:hypothetical protein FA95DRAFT_1223626 [Auriscalpium vulgare]